MSELSEEVRKTAEAAIENTEKLEEISEALAGASRRKRQNAAAVMSEVARTNAELLLPYRDALIDALNRPEARTRWECLDVLTLLVDVDSRACDKAIPGAEASLFDEESGPVRLAALRFLCKIGSTTENRSEKTWPMLDEAIQCYHGDLEFNDMLAAVVEFSAGRLSKKVKAQLYSRMLFDATNNKGLLNRRAQQIIDNVKGDLPPEEEKEAPAAVDSATDSDSSNEAKSESISADEA